MNLIRISAVSYTNTKPFVYGLMHSKLAQKIDLSLDIPSVCATKLIRKEVEIGLISTAALPEVPNHQIISQYCIGATGPVNSVFIFSNKPLDHIRTIRLDNQSRTSNILAQILLKNHWNVFPTFVACEEADAYVEIGDRTFGKKERYPYAYDLAEEWTKFSGDPFVFAVWASNTSLSPRFIDDFNQALQYGLDSRKTLIATLAPNPQFDLTDYLMNKIDFNFDAAKKRALEKFWALEKQL